MTAQLYEWGVRRADGTVAPMWRSEAFDVAPKWGGTVVCRVVTWGEWVDSDRSQPAEPAKVDANGSQRPSTENPLAEDAE